MTHDPQTLVLLAQARVDLFGGERVPHGAIEVSAVSSIRRRRLPAPGPSWCDGISESQRILSVPSSFGVVCAMHDCTEPVNLLAGLHLAAANRIVGYQEVLRASLEDVYPTIVDTQWTLEGGRHRAPDSPGLGAALNQEYLARDHLTVLASVCL